MSFNANGRVHWISKQNVFYIFVIYIHLAGAKQTKKKKKKKKNYIQSDIVM